VRPVVVAGARKRISRILLPSDADHYIINDLMTEALTCHPW
jgi:hypothetical protein